VLVYNFGVFLGQYENLVYCSCYTSRLTLFQKNRINDFFEGVILHFPNFEEKKNRNLCVLVDYKGIFEENLKIQHFARVRLLFWHLIFFG